MKRRVQPFQDKTQKGAARTFRVYLTCLGIDTAAVAGVDVMYFW